jgi:dTDP-4-dehydrorhamnose reductase
VSKPRLLIIGANGFLGQHLSKAGCCFEVFEADLAGPLATDVTSAASVDAAFRHARPNVVVLLAAVSDIDQCEQHPEMAEAVNVCGAAYVAEACARGEARMVFTSSAAVFDGARHGYTECDAPIPLSVYGRTKARAEQLILAKLPSALILRMALAIGFAEGSGTNAMLNRFAAKLRTGECVWLPDFEYRNPIDAGTFSTFLLELLGAAGGAGIFHVGATEAISRFELGVKLAERMGFSPQLVKPQTEPAPGRAPRGLDHFLLTGKLGEVCHAPIPSCDDVIERALHATTQSNS